MVALNQNAVKPSFSTKIESYLIGFLSLLLYTSPKEGLAWTLARELLNNRKVFVYVDWDGWMSPIAAAAW